MGLDETRHDKEEMEAAKVGDDAEKIDEDIGGDVGDEGKERVDERDEGDGVAVESTALALDGSAKTSKPAGSKSKRRVGLTPASVFDANVVSIKFEQLNNIVISLRADALQAYAGNKSAVDRLRRGMFKFYSYRVQ